MHIVTLIIVDAFKALALPNRWFEVSWSALLAVGKVGLLVTWEAWGCDYRP
jgi:hypothetical protein